MLHAQVHRTQDGGHFLLATPNVKNISMPDFMRVKNSSCGDLWSWSMRMGTIDHFQYEALTHRVDQGRLALLRGIREHDTDLSSKMETVRNAYSMLEAELPESASSLEKGVMLAAALHTLPAIIHSTRIVSDLAGVDEDYCFLTLGNDIDLHYDIQRLCRLADAPQIDAVCKTEGRPFEEGLAGLRTRLEFAGYTCLQTDTSILLPPLDEQDGLARLIPLYSKDGLVSTYKNMTAVQKEELMSQVDEDTFQFLSSLDGEPMMEPGLFAFDVMQIDRELDVNKLNYAIRGKMDEGEWRALVRELNLIADSFKQFQRAYRAVQLAEEEFLAKCSIENVGSRLSQGSNEETLLVEGNLAAERLSFALSSFAKAAASFSNKALDPRDPQGADGLAGENSLSFQFMVNLQMFLLNSPELFVGISGSEGIGEWMACSKSSLLAWNGWPDRMLEFIRERGTAQFDILSVAKESVAFADRARQGAIRLKAGEIIRAANDYVSFKERYGIAGTLYAMHVPENMTGDKSLFLEGLELSCLIQALDDVGENLIDAPNEKITIEELTKEIAPLKYEVGSNRLANRENADNN